MKRILLRTFRYGLLALLLLIIGLAVFLWRSSLQGRRDWDHYRAEAEARGTHFDIGAFVPPPVPDDQNFAKTPLWTEVFSSNGTPVLNRLRLKERSIYLTGRWNGQKVDFAKWKANLGDTNLLAPFQSREAELAEINEASKRPFCRFPVNYEDGFAVKLPHIGVLIELQRLYGIRSLVHLQQEQADQAFADEQTLARLEQSLKNEPPLISQLVRATLVDTTSQVIWEGLADHRWSEPQLAAIQEQLARVDLLGSLYHALGYERATAMDFWPKALRDPRVLMQGIRMSSDDVHHISVPLGTRAFCWLLRSRIDQILLALNQYYDRYLFVAVDPAAHRVLVDTAVAGERLLQPKEWPWFPPEQLLIKYAISPVSSTLLRFAWTQTTVDQAIVACALERYRLEHGEYPETLEPLETRFLPRLPHDIVTGGPLHYRRTPEGSFVLYALGWNGTDEGGVPGVKESGSRDLKQGDWVWFGAPVSGH